MKTKPDLPTADGVTVLAAVTLAGVHYSPGDHVSAEFWESKVSQKNQQSLIRTGIVTTDPADVGEVVMAVRTQHRTTLDEAAAVQKLLAKIQADKASAAQQVEDLEREHRANALSDYRVTGGKGSTRTLQLREARDRHESLAAAEAMAIEEIERLGREAKKLARRAELERGRMIKEKRRLICVELQAGVETLVPVFQEYHALAAQFRQLLRDTGSQITSRWRLENLIDEKLLGRAISKDLRVPDLAEIDDHIFEGLLNRAMKELDG